MQSDSARAPIELSGKYIDQSATTECVSVTHATWGLESLHLDQGFQVTLFTSRTASSKQERQVTLRSLAETILTTKAAEKDKLPWLKLARFGPVRSEKNSFRHDANLIAITGVEGDYDGEVVTFDEAVETLTKAGVLSIIYTSPSHTDSKPRWRVVCPTSTEHAPTRRDQLLGRVNGLFQGIFSSESWALSQSYFYGSLFKSTEHQVAIIDGDPVDELHELDRIWVGKPDTTTTASKSQPGHSGPIDEAALLAEIVNGNNYHRSSIRLLGKWARDGMAYLVARGRLIETYEAVPVDERDDRWRSRRGDVDRCLDDIYGKEAEARDAGKGTRARSPDPNTAAEEPWPAPIDFLVDNVSTGSPALLPGLVPEVIHTFATDTAGRMGVDPIGVAFAALVACSSVINEKWRIQPKMHDSTWTEAARLWGAIVGDPSILKTPIITACTRPIEHLDADARRHHADAMRIHKQELAAWKAAGSDPSKMPRQPILDRYMVEGTTVEALSEILRDDEEAGQRAPAGRVLVRQDEMSEWLAGFDRYRSGGRGGADRGSYLRLYNGGRHVVDRINRGSFAIPNWSACILGGIQPGPIQRIAREASDDGLLQRFLYCVPARQEQGEDRKPDQAVLARYDALFPALAALMPAASRIGITDPANVAGGSCVVLHARAHQHRIAIGDLVQALSALPDTSPRLRAAFGKWPGVFARLALTFHLIDAADARARDLRPDPLNVLSEATAKRAAGFMREVLLPHLLRAEAIMFSSAQTGHARWIAGFILSRQQPRIALRDVVQAYGALRSPESRRELLEVMESLVTVAWPRPEPQSNPARPPTAWLVNPAVHDTFAPRAELERAARRSAQRRVAECLEQTSKKEA